MKKLLSEVKARSFPCCAAANARSRNTSFRKMPSSNRTSNNNRSTSAETKPIVLIHERSATTVASVLIFHTGKLLEWLPEDVVEILNVMIKCQNFSEVLIAPTAMLPVCLLRSCDLWRHLQVDERDSLFGCCSCSTTLCRMFGAWKQQQSSTFTRVCGFLSYLQLGTMLM